METNKNINSLDELHKVTLYPKDYNVRNNPRPKAVTGFKLWAYNSLEWMRGKASDELSSNYYLLSDNIVK